MVFGFKDVFLKAFVTLRKEKLLTSYFICVIVLNYLDRLFCFIVDSLFYRLNLTFPTAVAFQLLNIQTIL